MSYSFTVRGLNKAEATQKVGAEIDRVVVNQPTHAIDAEQAKAVASAFIAILADDESRDVVVTVNGSLWTVEGAVVQQSAIGVNASLQPKLA